MIYLGIGSNLGEREVNLRNAVEQLASNEIKVLRSSSVYETAPRDVLDQPWFLNIVVECETRYFPMQLLSKLLRIERNMGRDRSTNAVRRGPRLIDIDILLYNNAVIRTAKLIVPHPRIAERRFVLEPLLELAPDLRNPGTKQPFKKSLAEVSGQQVKKLSVDLFSH